MAGLWMNSCASMTNDSHRDQHVDAAWNPHRVEQHSDRRRICNRSRRCDGQPEDYHVRNELTAIVALKVKVSEVYHGRA